MTGDLRWTQSFRFADGIVSKGAIVSFRFADDSFAECVSFRDFCFLLSV